MTTAPCFLGGSASGVLVRAKSQVWQGGSGEPPGGTGFSSSLVRGLVASPARFICSHEKPARKAASLFLIPIHQPWEETIRERRQQFPPQAS